jgi:hypothetical protein
MAKPAAMPMLEPSYPAKEYVISQHAWLDANCAANMASLSSSRQIPRKPNPCRDFPASTLNVAKHKQ